MQRLSHSDAKNRLQPLISDLKWRLKLIENDIFEEERKAGLSDPKALHYPLLALTLRSRRDNLAATITLLARQRDELSTSANLSEAA